MATLISFLPYDFSEVASVRAMAQGVSNAFSTFGWLPTTDGGNLSNTGNYGTATISNIALTSQVLSITFGSPTNQFAPGQTILLAGLTTNTFLNGLYVRITNQGAEGATSSTTGVGFVLTSVANASGGTTTYTGTITGGGTGAGFTGVTFTVAGFTTGANNGTWACVSSTGTTLVLANAAGVSETHAATATIVPDRSNTLLTATFLNGFTHADVVSVSDTGTITGVYNYNTITAPMDRTDTGYTSFNAPKKFRGSWVGSTPTFTQLQTTSNLTTLSFGTNGHGLDLTRTVGQGLRITGITNASFTWLNDASAPNNTNTNTYSSGWPITSLTSTTIIINTGSSPRADLAATPVTNGFASPYYVGGTSAPTVNDLVLYGGDCYEQIGTTAGGTYGFQAQGGGGTTNGVGTGSTPGADTTKWRRVLNDVWMSNDSLSSTNRIFFKIQWGANQSGSQVLQPQFYWGTNTDGSTNISQNYGWGTALTGAGAFPINTNASVITGAAVWESDFSGDSGRFTMILWRGFSATSTSPNIVLNIERSHDSSGNNTDAYWTVVYTGGPSSNAQQSILKPGTGGAGVLEFASTLAIKTVALINGQSFNNSIAAFPVFPIVGFLANPMINVISMKGTDAGEGGFINVSFYGTTHPYLMSKTGNTNTGGASNFGVVPAGQSAVGIRWE